MQIYFRFLDLKFSGFQPTAPPPSNIEKLKIRCAKKCGLTVIFDGKFRNVRSIRISSLNWENITRANIIWDSVTEKLSVRIMSGYRLILSCLTYQYFNQTVVSQNSQKLFPWFVIFVPRVCVRIESVVQLRLVTCLSQQPLYHWWT